MGNSNNVKWAEKVHEVLYENIIPFWLNRTVDNKHGGFYGKITNDHHAETEAPKSLILNTRILWTFSFLYNYKHDLDLLIMAERAYNYFISHFIDPQNGGTYWLLDYKGNVIIDKKKVYGQAFSIYALSEYYKVTGEEDVLQRAIEIFYLIEKYHYDPENKGYFETCDSDWGITDEMRLSATDMNEKKSMNAHLHIMEAYSSLYKIWKDEKLENRLKELIELFLLKIINKETNHFKLFFDEKWNEKTRAISFGHDIEGSWLLIEAAENFQDFSLIGKVKESAIKLVDATMHEGFNKNFGICSKVNEDGSIQSHTDWWQQAEAVVGLLNAYLIEKNEKYLHFAQKAWEFIENKFVDNEYGEWFYEISTDGKYNSSKYKVCEWKGPYHNGRACIEILKRLKTIKYQGMNKIENK